MPSFFFLFSPGRDESCGSHGTEPPDSRMKKYNSVLCVELVSSSSYFTMLKQMPPEALLSVPDPPSLQ